MRIFRKFDAGEVFRSKAAKGEDCQVRAACTALSMPYLVIWAKLFVLQGERGACSFTLVDELRDKNPEFRVVRQIDFPAKRGEKRMTGADFCWKYKRGRFVLRMAGHVVAVKDGQLYDTADCSDSCVYTAWEVRARPVGPVGQVE